jgi:DNA adenine methylase
VNGPITSLAPWFGAKRIIAAEIVREIGDHQVFWEPFCGSMAVLLAKSPCRMEVVNDLHSDLVNLARCLAHPDLGPALYRRLRRVLCSQEIFLESLDEIRSKPAPDPLAGLDPARAFDYFIASWQGMNGVAGTSTHNTNFARRFSSKGGDAGRRWSGAVASIPGWRRRLAGVQVLHSDGIDLVGRIEDRDGTAIYCDPPYLAKGARYLHDFEDADHLRLAEALRRFARTRVLVSYYADDRLQDLYPGWKIRPVEVAKSLVNSRMRDESGATSAPEVLLCNGPLATSRAPSRFAFAEEGGGS